MDASAQLVVVQEQVLEARQVGQRAGNASSEAVAIESQELAALPRVAGMAPEEGVDSQVQVAQLLERSQGRRDGARERVGAQVEVLQVGQIPELVIQRTPEVEALAQVEDFELVEVGERADEVGGDGGSMELHFDHPP